MTAQSVCRCLQLSITTNLTQFHITDLKMEDSICQHSELGTTQSSPINLFLTVRINLMSYFRRTYWTSQIDIQWQVRNHPGKEWTCFWLIQRLIATKSKKSWCPFLLLAPYSSGDLRPENCGFFLKNFISTVIHRITSELVRNLFRFFSESLCETQIQQQG